MPAPTPAGMSKGKVHCTFTVRSSAVENDVRSMRWEVAAASTQGQLPAPSVIIFSTLLMRPSSSSSAVLIFPCAELPETGNMSLKMPRMALSTVGGVSACARPIGERSASRLRQGATRRAIASGLSAAGVASRTIGVTAGAVNVEEEVLPLELQPNATTDTSSSTLIGRPPVRTIAPSSRPFRKGPDLRQGHVVSATDVLQQLEVVRRLERSGGSFKLHSLAPMMRQALFG
jgi:hypothetical protein